MACEDVDLGAMDVMSSSSSSERREGNVERIDKNHELWELMQVGAHVSRPMQIALNLLMHHGVVYDKSEDRIRIAEFNSDSKVRIISLEDFIGSNGSITIRKYDYAYELTKSVEIIERINKHMNEGNGIYHLNTNNCEAFAQKIVLKICYEYMPSQASRITEGIKDAAGNILIFYINYKSRSPMEMTKYEVEMQQKLDEMKKNLRPDYQDVDYTLKRK